MPQAMSGLTTHQQSNKNMDAKSMMSQEVSDGFYNHASQTTIRINPFAPRHGSRLKAISQLGSSTISPTN